MAAILGLGPEAVAEICAEAAQGEVVSPANLNGAAQVVIAGNAAAVERAVEAARAAGAKRAVPLAVSAPFHCTLMRPAAVRLRPVLEAIEFRSPRVPVYTNVDAAAVDSGPAAREALIRQVESPVRWQEAAERMVADGYDTFVEVGPGSVLTGLMRRVNRKLRLFNVENPEGVEKVAAELGGS